MFYEMFVNTKYEDAYIAVRRAVKVGALAGLASIVVWMQGQPAPSAVMIALTSFLAGLEKWLSERKEGGESTS